LEAVIGMAKAQWELDKAHSSISFSVRHMMVSNVRGHFEEFDATVEADENDLASAEIDVTIHPNSINTRNEQRDSHLRSADFFHADSHPHIKFKGVKMHHQGGENHKLEGHLEIRGTSKPVELNCEITGPLKDPYGNTRIGVIATGAINRSDFGITYNSALETGGVLIGDTVKLDINMEFIKKA